MKIRQACFSRMQALQLKNQTKPPATAYMYGGDYSLIQKNGYTFAIANEYPGFFQMLRQISEL